jgi:dienelactone hydrolase
MREKPGDKKMSRRRKILIIAVLAVIIIMTGFVVWAETPPSPMQEAFSALKSDADVTVISNQWLVFEPKVVNSTVGFIFYPGGRIDYRSYSPYAHAIAAQGFLTVIAPMPLNLAVFDSNAASGVIAAYSTITTWVVGGHSLGGTMAAQYVHDNPSKVKGLVLWAAYPESGTDLSKLDINVLTVHGTNDGLVSPKQIDDSLKQLPTDTIRLEIIGGDHAQFGWYGSQSGDNPATISREQQQAQTVNATINLLSSLHS